MSNDNMSSGPCDVSEGNNDPKPLFSVGDEFVSWAAKYWGLAEKYNVDTPEGHEFINFEMVKPYFVNKINELIRDNLKHSGLI